MKAESSGYWFQVWVVTICWPGMRINGRLRIQNIPFKQVQARDNLLFWPVLLLGSFRLQGFPWVRVLLQWREDAASLSAQARAFSPLPVLCLWWSWISWIRWVGVSWLQQNDVLSVFHSEWPVCFKCRFLKVWIRNENPQSGSPSLEIEKWRQCGAYWGGWVGVSVHNFSVHLNSTEKFKERNILILKP